MSGVIKNAEVIIVGAGFAGLSAALVLERKGYKVTILEARERVGGRSFTRPLNEKVTLDFGAQWICDAQPKITALVHKYGLQTFPTPHTGATTLEYDSKLRDEEPAEVTQIYAVLTKLAQEINVTAPWQHPQAREWDRLTFAAWLAGLPGYRKIAAQFVDRELCGGVFSCEGKTISLLAVLTGIANAGGVDALLETENGAQATTIVGGTQQIVAHMAAELRNNIHFAKPVKSIRRRGEMLHLEAGGKSYASRYVVIAVPPVVSRKIILSPGLADHQVMAAHRYLPGNVLKFHIQYATPFWRDKGLSGIAQTSQGYIYETYDTSPPHHTPGILTAFTYGYEADTLRQKGRGEIKEIILKNLAYLFGPLAKNAQTVHAFDWSAEQFSGGGFAARFAPGMLTTFGPRIQKTGQRGPVFWAGTEYARRWSGYIEGALISGEDAANQIEAISR